MGELLTHSFKGYTIIFSTSAFLVMYIKVGIQMETLNYRKIYLS